MVIDLIALVLVLVGLAIYFWAKNQKVAECGKVLFGAALVVLLFHLGETPLSIVLRR